MPCLDAWLVSRALQQSEFVKSAERRLDGLARGFVVHVEGSGQLLCDLRDRSLTVAPLPDEARRRIELMYLLPAEVEYDHFPGDGTDADVGPLLGIVHCHGLE